MNTPPCALAIAGSDPSGGAGIQADLKTFMAHGCYGAGVITALTAQNTQGVAAVHAPNAQFAQFVALELRLVLDDLPVKAAKTGMLASGDIVRVVASELADKNFPLVVDPVSASGRGLSLLDAEGVTVIVERLLPLADLVTPNRPEAELLTGIKVTGRESLFAAMERLLSFGCKAALVKGGHMETQDGMLTDWLLLPGQAPLALCIPKVDTPHTHGTGCALSAAITARLALGDALHDAVLAAQVWLNRALAAGFAVGGGASPPNHLVDFPARN